MRIAVCYYFGANSIPLVEDLAAAFEALGHAVLRFDSSPRESWARTKRLAKSFAKLFGAKQRLSRYFERRQNQRLGADFLKFFEGTAPELILVIRGERIDPSALARIKSQSGAWTVGWWVKNPRWQAEFRNEALGYDAAFSIDESFCDGLIKYLPCWAVNREAFFPLDFEEKRKAFLFLGAWSLRRQHFLESIADLPLQIIGPDWAKRLPVSSPLRKAVITDRVSQAVMADYYRSAWAVIDIRQIEQDSEQGVNMRFADVPASGTVLITEPAREVERWNLEGRCARLFSSPEELREQAKSLLADEQTCRLMSEGAVEIAALMPTFADRVTQILAAVTAAKCQHDAGSESDAQSALPVSRGVTA